MNPSHGTSLYAAIGLENGFLSLLHPLTTPMLASIIITFESSLHLGLGTLHTLLSITDARL